MIEPNTPPPRWIIKVLEAFCPAHLFEEIEGDLLQRFHHHSRTLGSGKAKRKLL
jgi:putative ABC transport system permease protein